MKNSAASSAPEEQITVTGTARVGRRASSVLTRLQPGDIAVLDHPDLDRVTAQALIDSGAAGVLNASAMISGRYPSLGSELLAQAGMVLVDRLGAVGIEAVRDARAVRVVGEAVLVGDAEVARGRRVDLGQLQRQMVQARSGLLAQLDTFTHNASEFLRREQDLVLNGVGLPELATILEGRPVVVVARAGDHEAELVEVYRFVREQNPVLIAVGKAADDVLDSGFAPHVVVVSPGDPSTMPSLDGMRAAEDVVVQVERGASPTVVESLGRLGTRSLLCETGATPEDVALLLADHGQAALVVGVGVHADLEELLDRRRAGLASTYLTRLKLGHTLVDASTIPQLYTGRVQRWHVLVVLLAGWLALVAAVSVTPVGQVWLAEFTAWAGGALDYLQGLF